jgi:hypothetical protein
MQTLVAAIRARWRKLKTQKFKIGVSSFKIKKKKGVQLLAAYFFLSSRTATMRMRTMMIAEIA